MIRIRIEGALFTHQAFQKAEIHKRKLWQDMRQSKAFEVLSTPFRHDLDFHPYCFYAVINIIQLKLKYNDPLYDLHI
jgi:hypothetical protein